MEKVVNWSQNIYCKSSIYASITLAITVNGVRPSCSNLRLWFIPFLTTQCSKRDVGKRDCNFWTIKINRKRPHQSNLTSASDKFKKQKFHSKFTLRRGIGWKLIFLLISFSFSLQ